MNIKNLNFTVVLVSSFLLLSCEKNGMDDHSVIHDYRVDDVLYAKGSKLKRVYQCSDDSKALYAEYKYDDLGRISRIDYGNKNYGYETYLYNEKGQLEKISRYHENLDDLISYIVYLYDTEGNRIKDQVFPVNEQMLGHYRLCEYADGKLIKQELVVDGQSPQYILYEYNGGELVKIKSYLLGSSDYDITENFYDHELLIYSIGYRYYENAKSGIVVSEVKRYYDRNDNLIKRVVDDKLKGSRSYITNNDFFDSWKYEYE